MPSSLFWAIMTTILASTISCVAAQTSCRGRCGDEFYRGYSCQCDYGCLAHEECCKDYESQCTQRHSCKGRCGEVFKRGRRCTCDPECVQFKQCCSDYKAHCDTEAEEEAELQKWTFSDDPSISPAPPPEPYDDEFSNDFYDQNFPILPDDPISEEYLEATPVPERTGGSEPTQATLPDDLFTQDKADLVYGNLSTVSPQTEMAPTDSSENKPTDMNPTPSPSDRPPTGTTIPESRPITQAQETAATAPPDSPTSRAVSEVSGEPVLNSTAQTGSIPTEDTPDLQTVQEYSLEFEASGSGADKPSEPSKPSPDESEVLPSTATTETMQPTITPGLTAVTPTSNLDANDTVVMDTTGVTEGVSSSDSMTTSTNATDPTQPTTTPGLTVRATSSLDANVTVPDARGVTLGSSSSQPTTASTNTTDPTQPTTTPGLTVTASSNLDANANVSDTTGDTKGSTSSDPNNASTNTTHPIQPTTTPTLTTTPTSSLDANTTVVMDTTGVTEGSSSSEPNTAATNTTEPTQSSTTPDLTTAPTSILDVNPSVVPDMTGVTQGSSSSKPQNTSSIASTVPPLSTSSSPGPQTDTLRTLPPSPTDPTVKDNKKEGRVTPASEPNTSSMASTVPTPSVSSSQDQTPDPEEPVLGKEEDAPTSTASSTPGKNPEASEPQAPVTEGTWTTNSPERPGPQTDTLSPLPPSPTDPTVKDDKEDKEVRVTPAPTKPATSKPTTKPQARPNRPTPAAKKPSLVKPTTKPKPKPVDTAQPSYQADDNNDMNLCSGRPAGAVTTLRNGTMVVFRGHYFWMLDRNRIPGPARSITQVWGVPSPVDTVFTRCNCQGKTYIFKGSLYWRFHNDVVDPGYPKFIHHGFDGLRGHITAALSVPQYQRRGESVYFFKRGGFVQKYSYQFGTSSGSTCSRQPPQRAVYAVVRRVARSAVSVLEPAVNIRVSWRGFPTSVTSAVSVPSRRVQEGYKYYVFSRSSYYNVQMSTQRPVIAAPQLNSPPQHNSANAFFKCP